MSCVAADYATKSEKFRGSKDEKLNVQSLECLKKGIGRLWDHLTPAILAIGKKLALFP